MARKITQRYAAELELATILSMLKPGMESAVDLMGNCLTTIAIYSRKAAI